MKWKLTNLWAHGLASVTPERPLPGDVILVGAEGKHYSNIGQSVVRLRPSRYSHAALNVTGELCIHSTFSSGITLDRPQDIVYTSGRKLPYRVYRYRHFSSNDIYRLRSPLLSYCASPFHRKYNWLFRAKSVRGWFTYWPRQWSVRGFDNVFCSELVARFYASRNIRVASTRVSATFPIDLERYMKSHGEDWVDVTEIYRQYFEDGTQEYERDLREGIQRQQKVNVRCSLEYRYHKDRKQAAEAYQRFAAAYKDARGAKQGDAPELLRRIYATMRANFAIIRRIGSYSGSQEHNIIYRRRRPRLLRQSAKARQWLRAAEDSQAVNPGFVFDRAGMMLPA